MKNAINSIANTGGIEAKRKYHLSKPNQLNTQKSILTRWWFIVSGEESTLAQLDESWNNVKLQTGWSLGPVLTYTTEEREQHLPNSHNGTESNPVANTSATPTGPNQQTMAGDSPAVIQHNSSQCAPPPLTETQPQSVSGLD